MTGLERRIHRDARGAGVVHAAAGLALGLGVGAVVRSTALATSSAVAGRALALAAGDVGRSLGDGDLERARALLPSLVGRDPGGLGPDEIARAVVESVAENTVDAVVAPAFWGAVAGAPGCARLPGRQHARLHGGPPLAPLRQLRVGERPARRRAGVGAGAAHGRAGGPRAAAVGTSGVGRGARPGARPSVPERRRGRGRLCRRARRPARRRQPLRRPFRGAGAPRHGAPGGRRRHRCGRAALAGRLWCFGCRPGADRVRRAWRWRDDGAACGLPRCRRPGGGPRPRPRSRQRARPLAVPQPAGAGPGTDCCPPPRSDAGLSGPGRRDVGAGRGHGRRPWTAAADQRRRRGDRARRRRSWAAGSSSPNSGCIPAAGTRCGAPTPTARAACWPGRTRSPTSGTRPSSPWPRVGGRGATVAPWWGR